MRSVEALRRTIALGWILLAASLPSVGSVRCLAIDPSRPSILYAGTDEGVYQSTDDGATWALLDSGGGIISLAIEPASPSTIYAGHAATTYGVRKSTDGGQTWMELDMGYSNPDPFVLVLDP